MSFKPKHKTPGGFSLIELLVAVAIFTIVMTVAAGALITMLGVNLKNRTVVVATNNLNVAVESMSREMRKAGSSFTTTGQSVSFDYIVGGVNTSVQYRRGVGLDGRGRIERSVNGGSFQTMTADDVDIVELSFQTSVFGSGSGNLLIRVVGEVGDTTDPSGSTRLVLQTAIAQRLDVTPSGNLAAMPAPSGLYDGSNIICPFTSGPGVYVLNFEQGRSVVSGAEGNYLASAEQGGNRVAWRVPRSAAKAPIPGITCTSATCEYYDLTGTVPDTGASRGGVIPPGTYDVYVVGWDNHCTGPPASGNPSDPCQGQGSGSQIHERGYIEVYDESFNRLFNPATVSGAKITDNIPDNVNLGPVTLVAEGVTLSEPARYAAAFHAFWYREGGGFPSPMYDNPPLTVLASLSCWTGCGNTFNRIQRETHQSFIIPCAAFVGPGSVPGGQVMFELEVNEI